ncbi:hypothetical protein Pmar_PMAR027601 [Perkinsus marinus ATCC 50983]|uniref:Uncharacterized protein n=1 Tax=Perkinsus marinus (strain ATCC 50983 / TXsc) TaxID=423536 RepID=C5KC73_PERM5|nr:hypothetical protein Pmar_PMAR027601 [Perkinsus marinus ATCC 50983]EER17886.1 hypothetical protein Pmar_PMAR027601 [Perkinsus marinus ATCC 50983]|eukprot:XP_002786090.1 hypothetical protein Pmar_PMAR027601 [Perkinsus marinus ATCC 50983]
MKAARLLYCVALVGFPSAQCQLFLKPRRFGDISEKTQFLTVELPKSASGLSLGSPVPFVTPAGCSPTLKQTADKYCVNGTYDASGTVELAMDLNIFDVEIPTKTVVLGIKTTLNQGNATNLTAMTGGCAMLLKQTLIFLLLDGVVTMCTSGGGQGKYDPKLPGYVSDITLSGELKLTSGIKTITDYNYSLPGYVHAGERFNMGMNASIFNSSGVPRGAGVNSTFTVMLHNIESSLFDWRIFLGLHTDSWVYPLPVVHLDTAIVDSVIHLKT